MKNLWDNDKKKLYKEIYDELCEHEQASSRTIVHSNKAWTQTEPDSNKAWFRTKVELNKAWT